MGRFASTIEFYSRYREPYPPAFFKKVAEAVGLRGHESLLDIGCGPGTLAIGFAPFVAQCTGIDPEPGMIAAAEAAAAKASVVLSLITSRIEEFSTTQTYDVITIGRALHWLEPNPTLAIMKRIVSDSGHILVCAASTVEAPDSPWLKSYAEVRRAWASGPDEKHHRIDGKEWFADSCFKALGDVSLTENYQVMIGDLIGRALSRSNTSPEIVAKGRARFEEEITAALEPFVRDGLKGGTSVRDKNQLSSGRKARSLCGSGESIR